jgi:hypothetical protein
VVLARIDSAAQAFFLMHSIVILGTMTAFHAFCAYEPKDLPYFPCMIAHNLRFDHGIAEKC